MKLTLVAIALAAAITVSSAAPSNDFFARSPKPIFWNTRGCEHWWQICGLKTKRDSSPTSVTQESIADQYSHVIKALRSAKELSKSGGGSNAMDQTGYTHDAFLFDFYGGDKVPATAKHDTSSQPGCVDLGLCDV